ncbi:MAG: nitroreductase family protein [Bacteroidetes bacterium]|nr:nitroreductase family protein [Bacteroidota bacterium]
MNIKELVTKNRSYRRFDEEYIIEYKTLESLINLARLSASGANRQPLKFLLCNTTDVCEKIFPTLSWAGYLTEWPGPVKGERPTAYIIILGDKKIAESFGIDHGIAAQSIMLGATEAGIGGCMISSIKRDDLMEELNIPENLEILIVLALGKPAEKVVVDEAKEGDIKYWRDPSKTHHVPKRSLNELIYKL